MIVHASIDENKKAKNGNAGDQTGKEVCTRAWYSKPWDYALRFKHDKTAKKVAKIAVKLANSNLVGYDQNQRNTLYKALKKYDFDVNAYIKSGEKTETDCSAFLYACWCCLVPAMRSDSNAPTTSTMKSFYQKHDFEVITDKSRLTSDSWSKEGVMWVKRGSHVVMQASNTAPEVAKPVLRYGDKGTEVKRLQQDLNYLGESLDTDGDFGTLTIGALKRFQKSNKLVVGGIYDKKSYETMKSLLS